MEGQGGFLDSTDASGPRAGELWDPGPAILGEGLDPVQREQLQHLLRLYRCLVNMSRADQPLKPPHLNAVQAEGEG